MAINTQKFLPGSTGTTKSLPQAKISSIILTSQDKKNVNTIRVKTIQIDKMLKGTLASDKKNLTDKKKEASQQRKEDAETKLEKKPDLKKKIKMPNILPRMGVLDWIKNFISNIILGYFAYRLVGNLPALKGLFTGIVAAGEFIIDWGGKILNGLVTFVDLGYKVYDGLRQFTGNIFGESGLKKFDAFMTGLNTFLNAVFFLGLAMVRVAPRFLGKGGKGGRVGIRGNSGQAGRVVKGGTTAAAARRYTDKFGKRAAIKKFGQEAVQSLGGRYGRSGVTNLARNVAVKTLGARGAATTIKTAAGILKPLVRNIPLIGGITEFILSWISGDPVGRAAFKGIGSGLGTWVGGALGTLVGGPIGTAIGMFLGGTGGSALGGMIYDMIFGGKKSPPKAKGYAKGGRVKKATRTIAPKIKRKKKRGAPHILPVKIDPGKSIGGEKKLKESPWWNPLGWFGGEEKTDENDPLGYFKKYGDIFGRLGYFGPMATLGIKALLGQKPSDKEYSDAALGLSALTALNALGFAGGGIVDKESLQQDLIKDKLKKSFMPVVDKVITELNNDLISGAKKKVKGSSDQPGSQGGSGPPGYMTGPAGTSGDKLTMARNLMRDLGLTEAQAAGIVGNMAAESGVENGRPQGSRPGVKAPLVVDGKTGYGLVQWTSQGRQQRLWDFAKSKGHDMSKPLTMDIEYQFFLKEFQGQYGHVLNQITKAKNVKDASTIFMQQYEIPAGYRTEAKIMERYNMSQPIYENLSSGKGTATEGVGQFIPSKDGESNVGGSSIVEIGKSLAKQGFSISEHPDFIKSKSGGIGQYSPGKGIVGNMHKGDGHYEHRALDVTNWSGGSSYRKTYIPVLDSLQQNPNIKMLISDNWGFYKNGKKSGPGKHGHDTHMHIETYHKGGEVPGKGERWAKLLGEEIVIDVDSAGPAKDLLLAINQASGRDGVLKAIRDYAPYESRQSRMIPFPVEKMVPVPVPMGSNSGSVVAIPVGGGVDKSSLTQIG